MAVASTAAAAIAALAFAWSAKGPVDGPFTVVDESTWARLSTGGIRVGPEEAHMTIVVFSDYTCRHCRALDQTLSVLRATMPADVAIVYRFFPRSDGLARTAALTGLCAAEQGIFTEANRVLFEAADTLAVVDWTRLVGQAAPEAANAVGTCLDAGGGESRLARDLMEAYDLDIRGTPLSVVNRMVVEGAFDMDFAMRQLQAAQE